MSKVGSFFRRNMHLFVAICFVAIYLGLSVVFMQFGFDGIVSTIFSNIILIIGGTVYIKLAFNPVKRECSARYIIAITSLLFFMWLFSQITATWVLNHVEDTGFESYQNIVAVNPAMYILLALIFAPVAEEILFRGIVFNAVKSCFPVWAAYIVSSFGFAIMHGTFVHVVVGFFCGMMFAMVYQYTGKITWAITLHCFYNTMSVFLAGITVPDVFFNPLVFLTVDVLIMLAIWYECRRAGNAGIPRRKPAKPDMPEFDCNDFTRTKSELICDSEHDVDIAAAPVHESNPESVLCRHADLLSDGFVECEHYCIGHCCLKTGICPHDKSE